MGKFKDLKNRFFTDLKSEYPETELETIFDLLVGKYLNLAEGQEQEEVILEDFEEQDFEEAISRLKNGEPIEYIIGEAEFFGRTFRVNPNIPIPRPETETLVRWVKEDFMKMQQNKGSELTLLDLGTGCGILSITLGKELPIETTAVGLSESALEVAKENSELYNLKTDFIQEDFLKWEELPKQFDIIVSHPPYILEKEIKDIPTKNQDFQPNFDLYVNDEDPMIFNRKIAELAEKCLSPQGQVYVEIINNFGTDTAKVFRDKGFKTEIRKDIFGNERILKAFRE